MVKILAKSDDNPLRFIHLVRPQNFTKKTNISYPLTPLHSYPLYVCVSGIKKC